MLLTRGEIFAAGEDGGERYRFNPAPTAAKMAVLPGLFARN